MKDEEQGNKAQHTSEPRRGTKSLKPEDPFPKTYLESWKGTILQTVLWEFQKSPLMSGENIAVPETGYPTLLNSVLKALNQAVLGVGEQCCLGAICMSLTSSLRVLPFLLSPPLLLPVPSRPRGGTRGLQRPSHHGQQMPLHRALCAAGRLNNIRTNPIAYLFWSWG